MIDSYVGAKENSIVSNIKRSKFIGIALPIGNDVRTIIKSVKDKYKDATHVCYAYRLINTETDIIEENFTDDKEPSGTAGLPILSVLKGLNLQNTIVFVIRYFGGIKLGTSGLIDAYRNTALSCVENVITQYHKSNIYRVVINYNQLATLQKNKKIKILDCSYCDNVICNIVCDSKETKKYHDINFEYQSSSFVEVNDDNN